MYAEIDKDRVRRLARELLEAVGEDEGQRRIAGLEAREEPKEQYTTVELARLLRVSQAWVTSHVSEFPGAFRLSGGQRANYRFPRKGVEEYIQRQQVA